MNTTRKSVKQTVQELEQVFENLEDVDKSKQVIAESIEVINRLCEQIRGDHDHTHRCGECMSEYTPKDGESKDCPYCGYDGT